MLGLLEESFVQVLPNLMYVGLASIFSRFFFSPSSELHLLLSASQFPPWCCPIVRLPFFPTFCRLPSLRSPFSIPSFLGDCIILRGASSTSVRFY